MTKKGKIGDWFLICCCVDAYELKTQEDIDEIQDDLEEEIGWLSTKKKIIAYDCTCSAEQDYKGYCVLEEKL